MRNLHPAQQRIKHSQHSATYRVFTRWLSRHVRFALLLLLMLSGVLVPVSQGASTFFFPKVSAHGLASDQSKPNRFDPRSDATSVSHPSLGKGKTANAPAGLPQSLKRSGMNSMNPGMLILSADHPTAFKGSDGRFEIDAPSGAVTNAEVAAAGGAIGLSIS